MNQDGRISKIFYIIFLACLAAGVALSLIAKLFGHSIPEFLSALVPPCIFRETLGIYCPGCGGLRSFAFLINGDVIQSFLYHPFVLYAAVLIVLFLIVGTISLLSGERIAIPKIRPVYFYIGAGIIILQWIIKLVALLVFDTALIPF